jgi:hypothetical protein
MIKFQCPKCRKRFGVPDDFAGRSVHCNQCKQHMIVPKIPAPAKTPETRIELQPPVQYDTAKHTAIKNTPQVDPDDQELRLAPQVPSPSDDKDINAGPALKPRETEIPPAPAGWYWPFLFPINHTGLAMIGMIVVVRFLFKLVGFAALYLIPMFGLGLALIFMIISFLVGVYACWYTCLCVNLTAQGQVKAPDTLNHDTGGFLEMIKLLFRVAAAVALCAAPAIAYYYYFKKFDNLFWAVSAAGWFFLPMTWLSVIMYDSIAGLNPFMIILAVIRTFFRYSLLALMLSIPAMLFVFIFLCSKMLGLLVMVPAQAILLYLAFVGAAILGRFYYRSEARLNWNV